MIGWLVAHREEIAIGMAAFVVGVMWAARQQLRWEQREIHRLRHRR